MMEVAVAFSFAAKKETLVNSSVKTIMFWVFILICLMLLWGVVQRSANMGKEQEYAYSDLYDKVQNGQVLDATIQGDELHGHLKTSPKDEFHTTLPTNYEDLLKAMLAAKVNFSIKEPQNNFLIPLLINVGPFVLLIAVWFFMLRQMQSGGNKALSFGKSRARLLSMQQKKVTFKDVAGVDEAKEELKEIIEYLREPQKFQKLGGRIPKGVLLVGPPGTGKTLLARAVAGEANVPFFSISGSDFVEMFVGVGASRVRDLFEQGKKNAPCIIFIDEIDAVGRHRGAGLGGGHDEREQTLNQLLVEMDGFESNDGVILVAATNRPDVLDPALLRPGRFDRRVVVGLPDIRGREEILRVHVKKVPVSRRHESQRAGSRYAGLQRRRSCQHGERGGAERGAHEPQASHHVRLRAGQGQGADGRRAQVDAADRRGEARHRVSRGRPRAGFVHARTLRPDAQGHHYSARHGAGRHGLSARRPAQLHARVSGNAAGHGLRRPRGRGDLPQPDVDGRGQRH